MQLVNGKRLSGKRIVLLIVTALAFAFIFGQSLLPQSISAEESGWFSDNVLNPLLHLLGFKLLSQNVIRKLAHITEFAILSVLLMLCFRGQFVKSAGIGFTAAFLDESVQLLSGRGAQITDVWIDLIGVAIGSLLGLLIVRVQHCRRERPRKRI